MPALPRSIGPAPGRTPLPPEVDAGPRDRPNVTLTFHGQGEAALARQLLTELERGGARVTVFAVGTWLAEQPAMARRVLDGGHELGNHTENHLDISRMTPAEAFGEIDMCAQRISKLTGTIGTWFRPSQTQHANTLIRAQASRVGYPTCVSYDVDSLDYTDPGAPSVVRTTLSQVQPGSIVSLHFGHRSTLAAIGPILDGLRQRGLHAVTLKELIA
ncbi:polysaccharide deacetylase family protein [Micromonospora sp. RTP1Z1]|uniref:polysaccharide deacetylase family protein n=1 Tax=Micromonospora sp. RTP1Z1 TaxID=2994043 RepID=UPI0029C92F05|nr:polysaccharide deacetylase family protein [Micromonospora sp. RTP1Z1]